MENKKESISWLIVFVSIVLAIGFVWFYYLSNSPSRTISYHSEIYSGAKKLFQAKLKSDLFLPQEVDGKIIGSATGFKLTWVKPNKKYNHFLITISEPNGDWKRIESGEHERTSLDISDLKPYTEYVVALQACLDPACEKWIVADSETRYTTDSEYWQIVSDDNTFETLHKITERGFNKTNEEIRIKYTEASVPEHIIYVWGDGTFVRDEDAEQIFIDKVVLEKGWYEQRLEFTTKNEKAWLSKKGYAVFLNP